MSTPHLHSESLREWSSDHGKPCRVCTSFWNWRLPSSSSKRAATKSTAQPQQTTTLLHPQWRRSSPPRTAAAISAHNDDNARAHCLPDSEALGRATWTFLHSITAYDPGRPSSHSARTANAVPVRTLGGPWGAPAAPPARRAWPCETQRGQCAAREACVRLRAHQRAFEGWAQGREL